MKKPNLSYKTHLASLFIILLFSLVPIIWFKPGHLLTGTDVDFPLFPDERLQERIYTWFPKILGGVDRSNNTASLPYVVSSAFFSELGFSLVTSEQLTFVLWFFLSGVSMYYLMVMLLADSEESLSFKFLANLTSVLIYMFNFYNVFLWVRLQLAIAGLVLFPIMLALLIGVFNDKLSKLKALLVLSLFSILCGPIGLQPPVLYVMFASLSLYVLFDLIIRLHKKEHKKITENIFFYLIFIIVFFLSSSYWAINLLSFIWFAGYTNSAVGQEVYAVDSLLNWTSSITSFTNLFRLYGDVVWFDGWADSLYFPEFVAYLRNPLLIFSSFVLPIAVFYPLLTKIKSYSKHIAFFSLLALLGLFFSKGIHAPFGSLFAWMIDNIPLFWIHRAPWQKFSFMTVTGYSVLGGIGVACFYTYLVKRFSTKNGIRSMLPFFALVTVLFLSYNYMFVLGYMFPSKESNIGYHGRFNLGFHHKFPSYLVDSKEYIESKEGEFKILLLPNSQTTVYDWGYAGATDIVNLLIDKGTVSTQYGEGFAPPQSVEALVGAVYESLYTKSNDISKTLGFINIAYILQRNDFNYGFFGDRDSPEFIDSTLSFQVDLTKDASFGKWDFYEVHKDLVYPVIYSPDIIIDYYGDSTGLVHVLENADIQKLGIYSSKENGQQTIIYLSELKDTHNTYPEFKDNDRWAWPNASISPNKFLHTFVKLKEKVQLANSSDIIESVDELTWLSSKRAAEIDSFPAITDEQQMQLIEDAHDKREKAFEMLRTIPANDYDDALTGILNKFISYGNQNIDVLEENDNISSEHIALLKVQQEEVHNWYTKNFKSSCSVQYCYEEEIPDTGIYSVKMLSSLSNNVLDYLPISLTVNGDEMYLFETFNSTQFINLEEGNTIFELSFANVPRDLSDTAVISLLPSSPDNSVFYNLSEYTELLDNMQKEPEVYYFSVPNLKSLSGYKLNFDYSIENGLVRALFVERLNDGRLKVIGNETFSNDPKSNCNSNAEGADCVKTFEKDFNTSLGITDLSVYLISLPSHGIDSIFTINNIDLHEQFEPRLLLTKSNEVEKLPANKSISYVKINPTKYKITITNHENAPINLIFNQNYHDGWRLYYKGKQISSDSHEIANTWANGWTVFPNELGSNEAYEIILEFLPQRLFYIGAGISFSTLLLFVALNSIYYVKKTKTKEK